MFYFMYLMFSLSLYCMIQMFWFYLLCIFKCEQGPLEEQYCYTERATLYKENWNK